MERPGLVGIAPFKDRLNRGIWPKEFVIWLVAIYIALFIIRPWEILIPELKEIRFERLFACIMILAVAFSGRARLQFGGPTMGVLAMLGALALSALQARYPIDAWQSFYSYLTLVIFYFVLISVVRTPYELCFLITCYLVSMGLYLSKAEWEYFVHGANKYEMGVTRLIGIDETFGHPNEVAGSVLLSLPILYFLVTVRKQITAGWPKFWRKMFPVCLAAYTCLAGIAIVLTRSRSVVLGLIVLLTLIALRANGIHRKLVRLAAVGLLLFAAWFSMDDEGRGRLRTIWDSSAGPSVATTSATSRWDGFVLGMRMFSISPIVGIGLGNFLPYRFHHMDGLYLDAHNMYGELLGETGLIGGLAFCTFVFLIEKSNRRVRRLARRNDLALLKVLAELVWSLRLVLIILLFDGLFGHNLLRFNWLWAAAFSYLSCHVAQRSVAARRAITEREQPVDSETNVVVAGC